MKNIKKSFNIDFSNGPVWKCIVAQAVPLTIAQLVQLLYNVVDRIYLGHMGDGNSMALTGVGPSFSYGKTCGCTVVLEKCCSEMEYHNGNFKAWSFEFCDAGNNLSCAGCL